MPLLGAHLSTAGGFCKAVGLAKEAGRDCVQLFTKNPPIRKRYRQETTWLCWFAKSRQYRSLLFAVTQFHDIAEAREVGLRRLRQIRTARSEYPGSENRCT